MLSIGSKLHNLDLKKKYIYISYIYAKQVVNKNPKFWNEIEPEAGEGLFSSFWFSSEFGGKLSKFRAEIKSLSLTKLRKSFALRNLLNQQKIDVYEHLYAMRHIMKNSIISKKTCFLGFT